MNPLARVWSPLLVVATLVGGGLTLGPRTATLHAAAAQPQASGAPIGMDTVRVGQLKNGRYEVVSLPLEVYVGRVLAGEAAPNSPPASLEALAIAIRTYTLSNRTKHAADGFDLCDQTHCQVMRTATPATERAALATAEQMLTWQGAPAQVFYSASCGGRSEKPSNVWPGATDLPYLPVHDDDGCGGFPVWTVELADADLQRALIAGGFRGTLRDVRVLGRNESGRVARIALDGMTPSEVSGQDLRMVVGRTLGFQHLQSTQFDLRRSGRVSRFSGRGAGHGVGMCVIGSMKLAARGESAPQILQRYFPGTTLSVSGARLTSTPPEPPVVSAPPRDTRVVPPPSMPGAAPRPDAAPAAAPRTSAAVDASTSRDVVIALPDPFEAGERTALEAVVVRERRSVADALGVSAPPVRVRVFDSADAFAQASGKPWFVLSAWTNGDIQLAPLWLLRERGMLERALRRQLVHQVVDAVLPERPLWIREGAAVHFADPDAPNTARPPCPRDQELSAPLSNGALGDALGRARACFARQVSGGRDWRRVR